MASRIDGTASRIPSPEQHLMPHLLALAVLMSCFTFLGVTVILQGAPLGHDEAVYALRSASFLEGGWSEGPRLWSDFRAPGVSALTVGVLALGEGAPALRVVVLLFGAAGIGITWLFGRSVADARVGLVAAALLTITPQWLTASTQLLPDVPGAVLGLAALLGLQMILKNGLSLAPLALALLSAMAATFTRYGAPAVIGIGATVVVLAGGRWAWKRRRDIVAVGVAMVGMTAAVLLWPPLTASSSPPLLAWRERRARLDADFFLGAASDFAQLAPSVLGPIVLGILGLATGWMVVQLVRSRGRPPKALKGPAVGATVALATTSVLAAGLSHGEARYLAPVLPFIAVWGAGVCLLPPLSGMRRLIPAGTVVVLLAVGLWTAHADATDRHFRIRNNNDSLRYVAIQAQQDEDCVILSSYAPQVEWYSGCHTEGVVGWEPSELAEQVDRIGASSVRVVVVGRGKRQPSDEKLENLLESLSVDDPLTSELGNRQAALWELQLERLAGHLADR